MSVLEAPLCRFTVLTPRLLRCEYSPRGVFEDRPTQWVACRQFPEAPHSRRESGEETILETEFLTLWHRRDGAPFSRANLSITLRSGLVWHYGDPNPDNLGGTARTLDECDGPINRRENRRLDIHPGIFSRSGWAVLEDSGSLVLGPDHLPRPRAEGGALDFYFFAYGSDFSAGLADFYRLTGHPPLLPSWVLGLWWSRWEPYRDRDLLRLADEFEQHQVPLSMLVIDMDWHVVANPYTSGWTGYTWNADFFPDPAAFFAEIHSRGLHACLNLHPADGVHPHEAAYGEFCAFLGLNPEEGKAIPFNPTDPKFLEGYFRYLHHPQEALGVDFWWIDWQQGRKTPFGDVDPLWVLNHLHTADIARHGDRRPLTFSRWCGPGAHRYPVGFSGDTYRTWKTLAWEVTFTSMASNLGFGWWSHDIGGFARGDHDDELYLRWVQFGALSPVFRFHNAGDPTVDHRPWSKPSPIGQPALAALSLRRALLPYLYTQAKANADSGFPLVRPLYFHHPDLEESYRWPGQYYFGPDLLAAPITQPSHPETGHVLHPVWLPPGRWHDFHTGLPYEGDRVHGITGTLESIPIFARAGAVIPLHHGQGEVITTLVCFPGESGEATLYLDDGQTQAYLKGQSVSWRIRQRSCNGRWSLSLQPEEGEADLPLRLRVVLRGWADPDLEGLSLNGRPCPIEARTEENGDCCLAQFEIGRDPVVLEAKGRPDPARRPPPTREACRRMLQAMPLNCHFVRPLLDQWERTLADPSSLARFTCDLSEAQIRLLANFLYDAGSAVLPVTPLQFQACWWNGSPHSGFSMRLSTREECTWTSFLSPADQACGSHPVSFRSAFHQWRCETGLLGIATLVERLHPDRDAQA